MVSFSTAPSGRTSLREPDARAPLPLELVTASDQTAQRYPSAREPRRAPRLLSVLPDWAVRVTRAAWRWSSGPRGDAASLGAWAERAWVAIWHPIVQLFARAGISPDAVTITGAGLTAGAALLLGCGVLGAGGCLYLVAASLDLVDGHLARLTGTASAAGAFLDSTLDRLGELLALGALAFHFRDSPAVLAAALTASGASVLVSYARARGEALGATAAASTGRMQRPERVALLGAPCLLSPLAGTLLGPGAATALVGGSLGFLAALTALSAVARCRAIVRALRLADEAAVASHWPRTV